MSYIILLYSMKKKLQRCQHISGWCWKHNWSQPIMPKNLLKHLGTRSMLYFSKFLVMASWEKSTIIEKHIHTHTYIHTYARGAGLLQYLGFHENGRWQVMCFRPNYFHVLPKSSEAPGSLSKTPFWVKLLGLDGPKPFLSVKDWLPCLHSQSFTYKENTC